MEMDYLVSNSASNVVMNCVENVSTTTSNTSNTST
jgi:hypothetical protein